MKEIIVYCDGACSGNPGPGGWGAIVWINGKSGKVIELGGGDRSTTNNRMELTGAIEALGRALQEGTGVSLYSDSEYMIKGMNEWVSGWVRRGWKKSDGKSVLNREYWEKLLDLSRKMKIKWIHVRGHAGNPGNSRCDEIAVAFSKGYGTELFSGNFADYGIRLGE